MACQNGHSTIAKLLLQHGAMDHEKDENGNAAVALLLKKELASTRGLL